MTYAIPNSINKIDEVIDLSDDDYDEEIILHKNDAGNQFSLKNSLNLSTPKFIKEIIGCNNNIQCNTPTTIDKLKHGNKIKKINTVESQILYFEKLNKSSKLSTPQSRNNNEERRKPSRILQENRSKNNELKDFKIAENLILDRNNEQILMQNINLVSHLVKNYFQNNERKCKSSGIRQEHCNKNKNGLKHLKADQNVALNRNRQQDLPQYTDPLSNTLKNDHNERSSIFFNTLKQLQQPQQLLMPPQTMQEIRNAVKIIQKLKRKKLDVLKNDSISKENTLSPDISLSENELVTSTPNVSIKPKQTRRKNNIECMILSHEYYDSQDFMLQDWLLMQQKVIGERLMHDEKSKCAEKSNLV